MAQMVEWYYYQLINDLYTEESGRFFDSYSNNVLRYSPARSSDFDQNKIDIDAKSEKFVETWLKSEYRDGGINDPERFSSYPASDMTIFFEKDQWSFSL